MSWKMKTLCLFFVSTLLSKVNGQFGPMAMGGSPMMGPFPSMGGGGPMRSVTVPVLPSQGGGGQLTTFAGQGQATQGQGAFAQGGQRTFAQTGVNGVAGATRQFAGQTPFTGVGQTVQTQAGSMFPNGPFQMFPPGQGQGGPFGAPGMMPPFMGPNMGPNMFGPPFMGGPFGPTGPNQFFPGAMNPQAQQQQLFAQQQAAARGVGTAGTFGTAAGTLAGTRQVIGPTGQRINFRTTPPLANTVGATIGAGAATGITTQPGGVAAGTAMAGAATAGAAGAAGATLIQGPDGSFTMQQFQGNPAAPIQPLVVPGQAGRMPLPNVFQGTFPGQSANAITGQTVRVQTGAAGLAGRNNLVPGAGLRVGAVQFAGAAGQGTPTLPNPNALGGAAGVATAGATNNVIVRQPGAPSGLSTLGRSPLQAFNAIQQGTLGLGASRFPPMLPGNQVGLNQFTAMNQAGGVIPPQLNVQGGAGALPNPRIPGVSTNLAGVTGMNQGLSTNTNTLRTASLPATAVTVGTAGTTSVGSLNSLPALPPLPSFQSGQGSNQAGAAAGASSSSASAFLLPGRLMQASIPSLPSLPSLPLDSVTGNSIPGTSSTTEVADTIVSSSSTSDSSNTGSQQSGGTSSLLNFNFPPPPPLPGIGGTSTSNTGSATTDTAITATEIQNVAPSFPAFPLTLQNANSPSANSGAPSVPAFGIIALNNVGSNQPPVLQDLPPPFTTGSSSSTVSATGSSTRNGANAGGSSLPSLPSLPSFPTLGN